MAYQPDYLTADCLYTAQGLATLDGAFLTYLKGQEETLYTQLMQVRVGSLPRLEESQLILAVAPHLECFLIQFFAAEEAYDQQRQAHLRLAPLLEAKRTFVQRYALKAIKPEDLTAIEPEALTAQVTKILGSAFDELLFATHALKVFESASESSETYTLALYAAWAVNTSEGQKRHRGGTLFHVPEKIDFTKLLHTHQESISVGAVAHTCAHDVRQRDGFHLTDPGLGQGQALAESHYCIWCHKQQKDSCATGLKEKGSDVFAKNPTGVTLTGCPLEEKISEMNWLKSQGRDVAALAVIVIDNPMVAATGHRICNDCMKSCIYQKQTPVNIPGVETAVLQNVLDLPWGFEIYSLLTRWNPLNFRRPLPLPETNHKVLVAGMGPAGFTLAHHLMNDGHTVVGVDGLKIEPLPHHLTGVASDGNPVPFELIHQTTALFEDLDDRVIGGFGGVAEYGITVRWNKNYLKLIRLLLERRSAFRLFDGVRVGGTLPLEKAFELGFDHVALCMGAGKPTVIPMKNNLAKGVRQASDFLMSLQLTGAAKWESIANLQMRLPVVVIGGGLTAIDTATEALAYYPRQVLKFARRYHDLVAAKGVGMVQQKWTAEDHDIATEMLAHAAALEGELTLATQEGRAPRFGPLLESWGGVKVVYRRSLNEAPSVTLNHEEVDKALEEGISILDRLTPQAIEVDSHGWASHLVCSDEQGREITLPAKGVLVAAGTVPNVALARDEMALVIDGKFFQALDEQGQVVTPQKLAKPDYPAIFTAHVSQGRRVSFFGDLHPSYAGNVVKAMGSAKQGYPLITAHLKTLEPVSQEKEQAFFQRLNGLLRATVQEVNQLTPTIVELVIKAPLAARAFHPGQFYRLQNYETFSPVVKGTRLAMEGLALTGASVNSEAGTVSTIVLEMGGSSNLCRTLKVGEPVVFMGPTGTPSEIPASGTMLLVGGGLGNAVLFSIGQQARAKGAKVLYFAGYRTPQDLFKREQIEAAADCVVWCCDSVPGIMPERPQDLAFSGNLVQALSAYAAGKMGPQSLVLQEVEHMLVIGSDAMMGAVAKMGLDLPRCKVPYGSINSPMQCMMKEICAQCLQRHVDPITGEEHIVFSCVNQDQPLSHVDFSCLKNRLAQNRLAEDLTRQWVDFCLVG
jgi:NADPH-dependent glutamate synthase beta subunit-like oxidoreductase/NAD(P)H-flavin reductase